MLTSSSPAHMKQLFDICRTNVKIWREFASGSHNDTVVEPNYFEYIAEFISDQVIALK
jgi:abhydrolase domain-containing protein 13